VKPIQNACTSTAGTVVSCDLLAFHSVQATAEAIQLLRRRPGPGAGETLPHNLLKHADEQTVVSVAAVLETIHRAGISAAEFSNWGVVAAPSFLGRATLVGALKRFEAEGAWGISPHFIPHRSQHAVSGTISQVLKIHGPNFGAGGSPGGGIDALLAGAVLLEGNRLPGVWVVLSDWEPEMTPDETGGHTPADAVCRATALALIPARTDWQGPRLLIAPRGQAASSRSGSGHVVKSLSSLDALLRVLNGADANLVTVVWQLEAGGWIELRKDGAQANAPKHKLLGRFLGGSRVEVKHGGAGTENQR
jgi:hypothetical protein